VLDSGLGAHHGGTPAATPMKTVGFGCAHSSTTKPPSTARARFRPWRTPWRQIDGGRGRAAPRRHCHCSVMGARAGPTAYGRARRSRSGSTE
jgi:hypothetical protein